MPLLNKPAIWKVAPWSQYPAGQAEHLAIPQPLPPNAQGEARPLSSPCAERRIVQEPHSVWAGWMELFDLY